MSNEMKTALIGITVGMLVFLGVLFVRSDSAEVQSYKWATTFCGGKDTDISEYKYIVRGHVECQDGRVADVPL